MSTEEKKGLKQQQLVSFRLGVEEYGVSIMKVQEIIRMQEITKVPQMPDFIEGIINLRGNVIPIIDLRKRFGLSCAEKTIDSRIVVVSVRERIVGIIVDGVSEVLRLSEEQIEPPPPAVSTAGREYIKGVGKLEKRLLILLDIDKILSSEEQNVIESAI
ncbi:MAG TPA: chemotaxis protein CheW [Candidatus Wallbacteria bacterium]|nr:chemotaxis protein CheW [Candidatus Wallbacteria bacterium]